ncbi:MAG: hypothetical protein ACI4DP_09265 [Candidatus Ornithomonoglobus sp.]
MKKYEEPGIKITKFSKESVVTVSGEPASNAEAAAAALREQSIENSIEQAYRTLVFK